MAPVCLTCGGKGKAKLLIYCRKCRDSAVHHYCMEDVSPNDDNINWRCWDCAPKDTKDKLLRKSERICTKRQKVLKTRNFWKGWLNQNQKLAQISTGVNEIGQTIIDRHSPISDVDSHSLYEIIERQRDDDDEHCRSPQSLCDQPYSDPDDGILAEPVIDPKWRGWFNINEEEDESCEILAHISNKACLRVSDAANEMPHTLDIQILDKHAVWPKRFTVSPPTAAIIALYFFPASDRDERTYDVLLDEVIERDLALKTMVNNVELLIFSSYELPLEHRRFNGKYFFWGVFRQKQQSHSLSEMAPTSSLVKESEKLGRFEPTDVANNKVLHDGLKSSRLHGVRSPLSTNSSHASNVTPSYRNTPDSLFYPPYNLRKVDNASACNGYSTLEEETVDCLMEGECQSRQFYFRPSPNPAAKVV